MIGLAGVSLLVLLGLAATAWVVGRTASRRLDLVDLDVWERFAVLAALGLALLGHLALLLGACGLLSRGPVLAAVAVLHLLGAGTWRELAAGARRLLGETPRRALGIGLAAVAVVAPVFLLALYPPTGFDETLYHLPFARAFAESGGVPFLPELRYPVFPQLADLLFAAVLLLAGLAEGIGDVATRQVELLALVATAALLAGWGRRSFSPAVGWMAAALFLGYPIVTHLAATAYIDGVFALFATAGLWAAERWRELRRGGWLALAAVFAASAAATKYQGLFFVAATALLALAAPPGRRVRSLLLAALVLAAVLVPWYGRILFHTGNPVFPFFSSIFGESLWTLDLTGPGTWERLAALPSLPWDVLFRRGAVGRQPPFSPAFLLGLPLLVTGAFRDGRVRRLVLLSAAYVLALALVPLDVRYLAAVLPVLSLALAAELARWGDLGLGQRWRRPGAVAALCVLFLLPGWLYAVYRVARQGPVPAAAQARDRYLAGHLPVYRAVRHLNRRRGSAYTVYAFHAENMTYFAEGHFLGDWNGPARFARLLPLVRHPEALHRELRRLGAGYLLVVDGTGIPLPVEDPAFRQRFRRVYSDGVSEVFEVRGNLLR